MIFPAKPDFHLSKNILAGGLIFRGKIDHVTIKKAIL